MERPIARLIATVDCHLRLGGGGYIAQFYSPVNHF